VAFGLRNNPQAEACVTLGLRQLTMHMPESTYYERNLPHWHPSGKYIFLTWRLHGSLPVTLIHSLRTTSGVSSGKHFRIIDGELDRARYGPLWLKDPRVADCIVNLLRRGEREWNYYSLQAFVVMPNHVHVLIQPNIPLARITQRLKGASARAANQLLAREGKRFWKDESFDHWVRNVSELNRISIYIEQNPVTARYVKKPENWPWSSATHTSQ
jgi:putative transposase